MSMEWVDCPAPGCSFGAVVSGREMLPSSAGPYEHARVGCPAGHLFFMPAERLVAASDPAPLRAG